MQAAQAQAQSEACKRASTFPSQIKLNLKNSSPSENKKYSTAQPDTTKTAKRSIDNGLQGRTTEGQLITAPTQKAGFRASYDSFVVNQTLVFQIKFCGKSPALRVAANRYFE